MNMPGGKKFSPSHARMKKTRASDTAERQAKKGSEVGEEIKRSGTLKDFQHHRFYDKLSLMSFKEMRLCIKRRAF